MSYIRQIQHFVPCCPQETADQSLMLSLIDTFPDTILTRDCPAAHLTSSAFIVSPDLTQVLMVFHNLYQSFTWSGGHADGDADLLAVAVREAHEETGIRDLVPLSDEPVTLDIIPVHAHYKNSAFVSAHLHLSVGYAFIGDPALPIHVKPDENSTVAWIPISDIDTRCTEAHMLPIYHKIIRRIETLIQQV